MTPAQLAEAFCRHDFASVYPYLADDVRWDQIGADIVEGKADVVAECEQSAAYLATVSYQFSKFTVIVGDAGVAVDSRAAYVDGDDTTLIASCDVFTFADGKIAAITSHTADITDPDA